jgi:hypothetical protein
MKNIKLYIYGGVFLLILLLGGGLNYFYGKYKQEKARANRVTENNNQLLKVDSTLRVLNVTKDELTGRLKLQVDSLAKQLDIKPKQIIKYVDWYITVHDTVKKEVKVTKLTDSTYFIADSTDCWRWEGLAILDSGILSVKRLSFDDRNEISDVTYWYRKWFLGKKRYTRDITAKCGTTKTVEVNIIKK